MAYQPKDLQDQVQALLAQRLKWSGRYMIGFISVRPDQEHSAELFSTNHFVTARHFMQMGFRIYDQIRGLQVHTVEELNFYHLKQIGPRS